jgi:hypothetical protein
MKMQTLIRSAVAALLGVLAAVLVSCGSSGAGLIPAADAGPLQSDFEAVAQDAAKGNGSCAATESALGKTEQDFLALPASVDRGLHARLEQGISNLRRRALAMCVQPTAAATTEAQPATTQTNTTTETTPTTTETTTPPSTPTTQTTTPPPSESGGTEAGEGQPEEGPGKGKGKGKDKAEGEGEGNGAAGAGGASAGGGQ